MGGNAGRKDVKTGTGGDARGRRKGGEVWVGEGEQGKIRGKCWFGWSGGEEGEAGRLRERGRSRGSVAYGGSEEREGWVGRREEMLLTVGVTKEKKVGRRKGGLWGGV